MSGANAKTKVGFVGLGNMGRPMSLRLVEADFILGGFDADRAVLKKVAAENGFAPAASLADLARQSEIVITMLPTGQIVREVALGPGGLASALAPGSILIDMSSSDAPGTVELHAKLREKQITLIDAPVSGGTTGAAAGTLAIMIGGDDEAAIERVWPILSAMGTKLFRTGGPGSGHATKSINNFLGATIIAATAEGLVMGARFGIEPETLLKAINASTGVSGASQGLFNGQVMSRKFNAGFALALMAKDVRLAAELAESLGMEAPYADLSRRVWGKARDESKPTTDFTEIVKLLEKKNGVELKPR